MKFTRVMKKVKRGHTLFIVISYKIMRIILVRHGEPDVEGWSSGKGNSYGEWLEVYNGAGIKPDSHPGEKLIKSLETCKMFVCSDLKRSYKSASIINSRTAVIKNPVFREFELPESKRKLPAFTPRIWSVIFRVLWFVGYSKNSENFNDSKKRIKESVEILNGIALKFNDIALVGHGLINKFIGMELKKNGWKKISGAGKGFWSHSEYFKEDEITDPDKE